MRWALSETIFFDASCCLGPDQFAAANAPLDAESLLKAMDRVGIAEALVYSSLAVIYSPITGNQAIIEATNGYDRLHPCWVLVPEHTRELPEGAVAWMVGSGVRAARLMPNHHRFSLSDWCSGTYLSDLAEAQVPTFIDYQINHWSSNAINYEAIEKLCSMHPTLPVILCGAGIADDRYIYPLLDRLPNLHLDLAYYQVEAGIEEICYRFGAERLLFATAMPKSTPGCSISYITYARISDDEKRLIAGDNLRNLLEGVRK